jgi:hypothetical protein
MGNSIFYVKDTYGKLVAAKYLNFDGAPVVDPSFNIASVGRKSEAPSATFGELVSAGAVGRKDGGWRFAYPPYLAMIWWSKRADCP